VVLSLLLIPVNAWWLIQTEYVRYADNGTTAALFFNAVSLILVLLLLNAGLGRLKQGWRFAPAELVVIYVVVSVATNLAGHDQLQILFSSITFLPRRAVPGDPWESRLLPHVPEQLILPRGPALDDLFKGNSTFYQWDHVLPWLTPLGWWTLFAMLVVWVMLCMTAIFRKQWEAERLTYPVAEVPIQVILNAHDLFRRPLLWGGMAIGAFGQILNLCHSLWPSVPALPIGVQYHRFPDFPLNAMGNIPISSFPFAVGLSFLLPLQIGFSCWFFFLFSRVEMVLAAMNGYTDVATTGFPYIRQQGVGASLGFAAMMLWASRGHLLHVVRAAFGIVKGRDEGEPMSYRLALFGFLGGTGLLILFAVYAGMQPLTATFYFALLLLIVLVVARLRAEVGLPTFEFFRVGADDILNRVGGTAAWSKGDLAGMSLFFWLTRTHRQFPMQTQVDSFRLTRRSGLPLSGMTVMILAASGLGILCAFWAMLHVTYEVGFESAKFRGPVIWAFGPEPWRRMDSLILTPTQPDTGSTGAYLVGAVVVAFLGIMRTRFVDWPFHPAGYLISGSFGLFRLWLPLFLAWLFKALILRYGGLRGYRTALPFFIGLVLGEFAAGFVRTLLDLCFGLYLPPNSGIGGL
jgi:uncharacterized protein DUF6785/uncharacterized protein DUF6784